MTKPAACYAALAGAGRGADAGKLAEEQRAQWRRQAREWLRADLDRLAASQDQPPIDREFSIRFLSSWKTDADLAGLRDRELLADLSQAERDECLSIWSAVDAALARCRLPE